MSRPTAQTNDNVDSHMQFYLTANRVIRKSGQPNFKKCKMPIPSTFNFDFIEFYLSDYTDNTAQLLKFGFPLGNVGQTGSTKIPKNHIGAHFLHKSNKFYSKKLKQKQP